MYHTKDVIIESFRKAIEYDTDDPSIFEKNSECEILDENCEGIALEQLLDGYFINPEMCFKRGI